MIDSEGRYEYKTNLVKKIINAYEEGDNDTFKYATEQYELMYGSESYHTSLNFEKTQIDDDSLLLKVGRVAISELGTDVLSFSDLRVAESAELITESIYNLRRDIGRENKDIPSFHCHLFKKNGKNEKDTGLIITVVDRVDGYKDVYIGNHAKRVKKPLDIDNIVDRERAIIAVTAVKKIGEIPSEFRRIPGDDAVKIATVDSTLKLIIEPIN